MAVNTANSLGTRRSSSSRGLEGGEPWTQEQTSWGDNHSRSNSRRRSWCRVVISERKHHYTMRPYYKHNQKNYVAREITIQRLFHRLTTRLLLHQVGLRTDTTGLFLLQPSLHAREVVVILLSIRGTRGLHGAQPLREVPARRLARHLATIFFPQERRLPL